MPKISFCENFFQRPSFFDALANCFNGYPCSPRPLRNDEGFSLKRNKYIVAAIRLLLLHRSPSAITWFVVSCAIWKSINGMLRGWALSHISQKVFKVLPTRANRNTFSAIFFISWGIGIFAARTNIDPRIVFNGSRKAVGCIANNAIVAMNVYV